MNIFLLSPKAYGFARKILGDLYSYSHIQREISPILSKYVSLLTYTGNQDSISQKIKTILELRLSNINKGEVYYAAIGGDAASVIQKDASNDRVPKNLYVIHLLPLDFTLPTFPLQFEVIPPGTCPDSTVNLFNKIINVLNTQTNIRILFKTVDGEAKMNKWFSSLFSEKAFFDKNLEKDFSQILQEGYKYAKYTCWPVSDLLHLFKCGRAHCIGHLICVNTPNLICLNIELFKEATGLLKNIEDKSTQGRMNDQYAVEFFSYDSFIRLLAKGRYEGAFYVLPFMALNEAVRGHNLSKNERIALCDIAFRIFRHHYKILKEAPETKMFPQKYSKEAIGTTFGESIFIQRCMCTTVGIGIALTLEIPRIGLERVGTHCIECDFGTMRILQHDINTPEQGVKVAAKSFIVLQNNDHLQIPKQINTRENNGGVKISCDTPTPERLFINPDLIVRLIYNLMINGAVEEDSLESLVMQLNSYSSFYVNNPTTKLKNQFALASAKPFSRYLTVSAYRMSVTPVPQDISKSRISSPLSYYFKNDQNVKQQARIAHWRNLLTEIMKYMSDRPGLEQVDKEYQNKQCKIAKILSKLYSPGDLTTFSIEEDSHDFMTNENPNENTETNTDSIPSSNNEEKRPFLSQGHRQMIEAQNMTEKDEIEKQTKWTSVDCQPQLSNQSGNGWSSRPTKWTSPDCQSQRSKYQMISNFNDTLMFLKEMFDAKYDSIEHSLEKYELSLLSQVKNMIHMPPSLGLCSRAPFADFDEREMNLLLNSSESEENDQIYNY